ncbi:hypothetical protein AVEN_121033-1 [Araneus ventricosus]|uniref:Histone-lysine N-methyltransferase SETMAR n=1 Tax=Araneus ventricosus TaxID=182803 RepID=A0A4Y2F4W8_ARAVE|nr:hypothetical protein AVEN_121033-1 [Araneus ventricosus]
MLINFCDAIYEKRRSEFKRKVVLFNQDNAWPHVSMMTGWTLYKLEWDLMQHPPYSPDIAPSDFYLFSHLQLHLHGTIFNANEVDVFLDSLMSQFFTEGIEEFTKRWQTIVDLNRDYYSH